MTGERPVASVPVRAGLFVDDEEPSLSGGRCARCDRHHFPRSSTCPYCSSEDIEFVTLSRRGQLWAWTSVSAAPPGYRGPVPYGFGVVELAEGLRVVSRLTESDPALLHAGQEMELVLEKLQEDSEGRDVTTYAFSPATGGHSSEGSE
jgi:uncharacterized OB-fold protein